MNDYKDNDDLGLFLAYVKSISVDYSSHDLTIFLAKPYDHKEHRLRYVESELALHGVRYMNFRQNLSESEVPEFHRSAVLEEHPDYELRDDEKVFFFGLDWGSEYCEWYFIANSYELREITEPLSGGQLTWVV